MCAHAQRKGDGMAWETLVHYGVILQSLDAAYNGNRGPFEIANFEVYPDFFFHVLPPEIVSIDEACVCIRKLSRTAMSKSRTGNIIMVVISSYANFPAVDGFVVYQERNESAVIVGYQAKAGDEYPNSTLPEDLEDGYVIQGKAPTTKVAVRGKRDWRYWPVQRIKSVIGFSLENMIPRQQ
jgi:hypothetical protein